MSNNKSKRDTSKLKNNHSSDRLKEKSAEVSTKNSGKAADDDKNLLRVSEIPQGSYNALKSALRAKRVWDDKTAV